MDFNNTEIAFRSKSNKDLNRAYWLFKIIGYPSIVKIGKPLTNFAIKTHLPIQGIIKNTIFKQFCGGTNINDCEETTQNLFKFGIGTILDYSVEGKTSLEDFESTTKEIISTILKAKDNKSIPFAVFKVTGISRFGILEKSNITTSHLTNEEKSEYDGVIERIDRICKAGYDNNVPVFIDAEETWIQDVIDRITKDMMRKYNKGKAIIFNTLQMYRHDRIEFLHNEIEDARKEHFHYGIKLVRGAYMEKERERAQKMGYPSPIQKDKKSTDLDYDKALSIIIENIDVLALCAGTHNEESSKYLTELIQKNNLSKNDSRIYFAQLLGMSDHISYNLSSENFNVAKYVPYGPINEVLPYLLRRADENTSVAGQTSRELNLLLAEKNRRSKQKK
jgi:proline dehydrogenase